MKRFDFPYQRLMEWRDRLAEQERNKLEQLHAARNLLEKEREELAGNIASSQAAFASAAIRSAEDLRHLAAFVGALRTKEEIVRDRSVECQESISTQTKRCVEADRGHELLARLRNRQLSSWHQELDRETEKDAADSWLSGHARSLARNGRPETD